MGRVTDTLDFALNGVEGLGAVTVQRRHVQDSVILLDAVDEDRKALQVDVIILTVYLL